MDKRNEKAPPDGREQQGRSKKTRAMLRRIKSQMQNQVELMQTIVGEDDIEGAETFLEEVMVFSTLVPKRLEESLRVAWPQVRKNLAELGIEAELNLVENTMSVKSTPEIERVMDMLKAKDLLKLLARGFPCEQALLILRSGYNCDFIKIGGSIASRDEFVRRRNRLIGPQGSTLKTIELLTGCYLLVYGNTVCVIGKGYDGINKAGEIILDCMNKINPISHIRRLVIMRELENHPKIKSKDYIRFLPPVKKRNEFMTQGKQNPRNIDFLLDDPSEMTNGRRLALALMKFKWYNVPPPKEPKIVEEIPKKKENENLLSMDDDKSEATCETVIVDNPIEPQPSLEKAWAFFEHSVLPRYMLDLERKQPRNIFMRFLTMNSSQFDVAEPGENTKPTRLYSFIFTPLKQMGDFGLGIGLYFSTLRSIAVMTLVAGLILIPNMQFFVNGSYRGDNLNERLALSLAKYSAMCDETSFVPCEVCDRTKYFSREPLHFRVANVTMDDGTSLNFALKNECNFDGIFRMGMISWGGMIFLLLYIFYINSYSETMEVGFDEDEQTAQDYSLVVDNPPSDAIDPEEWKAFFEKVSGGHVTVVTVAVDNDLLLRSLVDRRSILEYLKEALPPGTKMSENNLAKIAADCESNRNFFQKLSALILAPFGIARDNADLYNELVVLTSKVRGLSQIAYPATKIYVTFETESAQRNALSTLSLGKLDVWRQKSKKLKRKFMFRGKKIVSVSEPQEPSTVRWQDLNSKWTSRVRQLFITSFVSLVALLVCAAIVIYLNAVRSSTVSAYAISISNSVFPLFAKAMTSLEYHPSESSKQSSLYVKIALFRWINTAFIIFIITPSMNFIAAGPEHLVESVHKIFFAEVVTMNVIQLFDIPGNLKKHYLARRAHSQTKMNKMFQGTTYELAERYTNMTKIMFLAFFYMALYPAGLFMCAIALFVNYYTDSFSLMKTWAPAPKLGNSVSKMSRKYFFSLALIFLSLLASVFWAGFPFDNLCEKVGYTNPAYYGNYTIDRQDFPDIDVSITENTPFYDYCNMEFLTIPLPRFQRANSVRHLPRDERENAATYEWFQGRQGLLVQINFWTCMVFIFFNVLRFLLEAVMGLMLWFKSDYEPSGKDMKMNFSNVEVISAYIPQVKNDNFVYPLIACDVDNIGLELYDWNDPDHEYSYHSVISDAKEMLKNQPGASVDKVFSRVMHWPPGANKNDDDSYR